jgi:ATP-dependent Clp protease, protease subunit
MAALANDGVPEVQLLLSTPGGAMMNGMNLYNVLRAMPFHLVTHNVANVDSVGNVVFLAGDTRYACPYSTFMFHGVGFDMAEGTRLEEKLLREHLGGVLAEQTRMAGIMGERSKLATEEIESLFLETQTKDAAYAVRAGIVDEIRDVEIPPGSPVFSLVFER